MAKQVPEQRDRSASRVAGVTQHAVSATRPTAVRTTP